MSEPVAFFLPHGDHFEPTVLTRGPWRLEHQHGGPPAALMVRAIEQATGAAESFQIARFTMDFMRPVPIEPVTVQVEQVRESRRVRGFVAEIRAGGEMAARATALLVRTEPPAWTAEPAESLLEPLPDASNLYQFPFFRAPTGYHTATELRLAGGVFGSGRASAWMRQVVPLVPGETPSPAQRLLLVADSGSGVGATVDPVRFAPFINADLNVSLHRLPEGEWIGLDAATTLEPHGLGLTRTRLYDVRGPVGEGLQALVAGRMGPA
ncbi:MAG TPA: thioesterase family protein [Candidatus Bathyarchaeia archaeon]|nr:thioesterase family protein [Candidatus Bathyarchaeia archaeon]